jgi:ABC-2 type transport system permease protein
MTTLTAHPTSAGPRARKAASFGPLLRTEGRLFLRSAGSVLWSALIPLAALIALGAIPATRQPSKALHGISYLDAYLPILMMFALCMAAVNLLPPNLAMYREQGVLRRMSTTPVRPSRLLAAQVAIYLGLAVVVSAVMLIVTVAGYGVRLPHQIPGFVLSLLLVAAAVTSIGCLIAALAPNAKAANALSLVTFFPLMFFAGLWIPRASMAPVLRHISDWTPLGAGVRGVQAAIAGHFPPVQALLALVAYTVIVGAIAVRTFRWE